MATDLGTTTRVRGQVTSLRINGWLVGSLVGCCGVAFWVQVGKDIGQGGSEVGA